MTYEPCVIGSAGTCTRWSHEHNGPVVPVPGVTPDAVEAIARVLYANQDTGPWPHRLQRPIKSFKAQAEAVLAAVYPVIAKQVKLQGWVSFGTHAPFSGVPLEFSDEVGEDLLPMWERVARSFAATPTAEGGK